VQIEVYAAFLLICSKKKFWGKAKSCWLHQIKKLKYSREKERKSWNH
jgi:hypothetical protein